jgi:hypothetical protein
MQMPFLQNLSKALITREILQRTKLTYLLSVGMQIKPAKIKHINTDTIEIIPEKSLVFFSGQNYALLKPDNLGTRIIGKGITHAKITIPYAAINHHLHM